MLYHNVDKSYNLYIIPRYGKHFDFSFRVYIHMQPLCEQSHTLGHTHPLYVRVSKVKQKQRQETDHFESDVMMFFICQHCLSSDDCVKALLSVLSMCVCVCVCVTDIDDSVCVCVFYGFMFCISRLLILLLL